MKKTQTLHDQQIPVIRLGLIRHQEARMRIQSFLFNLHIKAEAAVVDRIVTRIYEQSQGDPDVIDKLLCVFNRPRFY